MQFYLQVSAFTMMGGIHLAATVRQDTPEGAIAPVLMLSTDVLDAGDDDPVEFARDALIALLECL